MIKLWTIYVKNDWKIKKKQKQNTHFRTHFVVEISLYLKHTELSTLTTIEFNSFWMVILTSVFIGCLFMFWVHTYVFIETSTHIQRLTPFHTPELCRHNIFLVYGIVLRIGWKRSATYNCKKNALTAICWITHSSATMQTNTLKPRTHNWNATVESVCRSLRYVF